MKQDARRPFSGFDKAWASLTAEERAEAERLMRRYIEIVLAVMEEEEALAAGEASPTAENRSLTDEKGSRTLALS